MRSFVAAFEFENRNEVEAARAIYQRTGASEDDSYRVAKPMIAKVIQKDMQGTATALKVSEKEACQFMEEHAEQLAAGMALSKVQPEMYAALHSPQP